MVSSTFELTDEELSALHSILENEALYGDDEIVYGDGDDAVMLRILVRKVEDEARKRRLWWAR